MPEKRVISVRKVLIFKYAQYERQKELISKEKSVVCVRLWVLAKCFTPHSRTNNLFACILPACPL
jgi:hypothetical protein